jgi:hypothetical protein
MSWKSTARDGTELTVLALPSDVKATLINRKAITRQSVTSQIVEALRDRWSCAAAGPVAGYRQPPPGVPMPVGGYRGPAVVANPTAPAVITSGPYKGMIQQPIVRPGDPRVPDWNM